MDEMEITGSAGSPRLQDRIQHDVTVLGRSVGFLGKSSAIRWMEEIVEKVSLDDRFHNKKLVLMKHRFSRRRQKRRRNTWSC